MMQILRVIVLVIILGCGRGEHQLGDSYAKAAALAIEASEKDGRQEARKGSATGNLMVDVRAFDTLGRKHLGVGLSEGELSAALRTQFINAEKERAVQCAPNAACLVADDGIYITLDSLGGSGRRIRAVVTSFTTDQPQNAPQAAVCRRTLSIVVVAGKGQWVVRDSDLLNTC
jgi:hypothetical protein